MKIKPIVSLRRVLVIQFVLQIFAAVGVSGYLCLRNGQKAVNHVAMELRSQISDRLQDHLQNYAANLQLVNQLNAQAIELGELKLEDTPAAARHFWKQLHQFSSVTFAAFASEARELYQVRRSPGGSLTLSTINNSTDGRLARYPIDDKGDRTKLSFPSEKSYDPRTLPWYRAAATARKPILTAIYSDFNPREMLGLALAQPLYGQQGKLRGVLASGLFFEDFRQFLSQIKIDQSGLAFIIDRDGRLVFTSTQDSLYRVQGEKAASLYGTGSDNPSIRLTAQYLSGYFGNFNQVKQKQSLEFNIEGNRQFIEVTPLKQFGIDWLVVVAIPEADFIADINAQTRLTVLLSLVALGMATVIGILTSRWISRPILNLSVASRKLASGEFNQQVKIEGVKEVRLLAESFNQMSRDLWQSHQHLEDYSRSLQQKVEERTVSLRESEAKAEAASRAKSIFLASMSHELRTPLHAILGYTQMLKRDREATPKQQDSLDVIYQCGTHLLTLIEDILDVSKIDAGKLELYPTDFYFHKFLKGAVEIFRLRAEQKGIRFSYQTSNQLPTTIHADEKRLRQVLINLLGNAIKFTEIGGVTFKVIELDNPEINFQFPMTKIRFQIEDTGSGMTPEQLERIFSPFEQFGNSNQKNQGTGLGLAITQKLLSLMGSEVKVESTLGRGSKFWFDIEVPEVLQEIELIYPRKQDDVFDASSMIFPSREELNKLYLFAQIGNIHGIQKEAIRLRDSNPKYLGFSRRILYLADAFEDRAILDLIQPYFED